MKRMLSCILSLFLLLACVPTPEQEAIVAPSGYEAAILGTQPPQESSAATRLPEHWNDVIKLRYWDIEIDAEISPDAIGAVSVYESRWVTMDEIAAQADKVRRGLLKDATAYSDAVLSEADWYREIQRYADTPAWDNETGGYTRRRTDAEVDSYRKDLSSFIEEAPNELEYHSFSPMSDAVSDDAGYRLSDGSLAWMHGQSKSISVLYGAELFQNAVEQPESWVLQGDELLNEPAGTRIEGVTVEERTAREQAQSLLNELSFAGYKIAKTEKARYINDYTHETLTAGYQIVFCRAEGTYEAAYGTIPQRVRTGEQPYRPDWPQEQIYVFVDETGVRSFFWTHPTAKPKPVNEAVEILSFEEVQDVIFKHLKNCFSYEEDDALFREWYAGRSKYLVDHVGLYMEMIPMKNRPDEFWYGPVWIVTVRSYPADADVAALPYTMPAHYLHVNAIDGSLIGY